MKTPSSIGLTPKYTRVPASLEGVLCSEADEADVLLALPLHALALAHTDAYAVAMVPLLTTVTANHKPGEGGGSGDYT